MDARKAEIDCRKKCRILLSPGIRGAHLVPGWQFTRRLVQMKIVETAEMAPTCHAGYQLVETAEVAPTCHNFSLVETAEVAPTCH
jgi:hypothetical protein